MALGFKYRAVGMYWNDVWCTWGSW